ncbi:hypothetical protein C8R42DRAFT_338723 [Lentinula raphanica]|nr:hypothetical protein C8R42DRAFT_338723 [Lentinula raphanica]
MRESPKSTMNSPTRIFRVSQQIPRHLCSYQLFTRRKTLQHISLGVHSQIPINSMGQHDEAQRLQPDDHACFTTTVRERPVLTDN